MSRTLIFLMVLGLLMASCAGVGRKNATTTPVLAATPTALVRYIPRDPLGEPVGCESSQAITMDADLQGVPFFEMGVPGGEKVPVRSIRIVACIRDEVSEEQFGSMMLSAIDDFLKIAELEPQQFVLAAESIARWHLQKSGYGSFSTIIGEETSLYVDVYSYYPLEVAV